MRLPDFAIETYYAKYEFTTPLMLSGSDCESVSVRSLLDLEPGAADALMEYRLGYTETRGAPALREAVADSYESIDADGVLIQAGASEVIFVFMNAMLAPGDHVIVHTPCYQSLADVARGVGCEVTPWVAREEDGWRLDVDALDRLVRPTTRAVVVNCPHNPTGYLMTREEQRAVVDAVERHGLILFSDEVYRGLEHDPADRLPAACDLTPRAVSVGVLSKSLGLPGLRIGWAASRDRAILDAMHDFKHYTSLCSSGPSELLATVAMRHRDRLLDRNRQLVLTNLSALHEFFARHNGRFGWHPPRAGAIGFPSLRGDEDVDAYCDALREEQGVLLLPGRVYQDTRRNFRVGFGRANFPEALARWEAFEGAASYERRGARSQSETS